MINSPLLSQLSKPKTVSAGVEPPSSSNLGRGPLGSKDNPWHWWDKSAAKDGDYVYERPSNTGIGPGKDDKQKFLNMDNLVSAIQGGNNPFPGETAANPERTGPWLGQTSSGGVQAAPPTFQAPGAPALPQPPTLQGMPGQLQQPIGLGPYRRR